MTYFPEDYRSASGASPSKSAGREKYFDCKLGDGESATLRPCGTFGSGHVIAGWVYYTMEGQPRRFPSGKYPENFAEDIGLSYQGKTQGTGEKDKPKYFLSFVALSREKDDFVIVTLDKKGVREQYEEIHGMEDYQVLPTGMANFFFTIKRKGKELDTTYLVTPTLKPPTKADEKRWAEAAPDIWLPALYDGADPWAGKPAGARPPGLPPTHRDETGADHEIAVDIVNGVAEFPASW